MSESSTPKVAEGSWRVRLIVMDGVLVALLGWLLYVVIADRGADRTDAEDTNPTPVGEAPLEGSDPAPESAAESPADAPDGR